MVNQYISGAMSVPRFAGESHTPFQPRARRLSRAASQLSPLNRERLVGLVAPRVPLFYDRLAAIATRTGGSDVGTLQEQQARKKAD